VCERELQLRKVKGGWTPLREGGGGGGRGGGG